MTRLVSPRTVPAALVVALSACSYSPGARHAYAPSGVVLDQPAPTPEEPAPNTESYDRIEDNPFLAAKLNPLSTFSIDVDTASYSNVRRFLKGGELPPKDAVRIEELVNYFPYRYEPPAGGAPFSAAVEIASCPWEPEHRLARIGLKGREIPAGQRPASNLVFLLDVSGSMKDESKLPLLKEAFALLLDGLDERDRVAIAVYAGDSGLVLEPTPVSPENKKKILAKMERLKAGGSTHGAAGIELAYKVAEEAFLPGGVNRVILATDGDFNVGISSEGELTRVIEEKAKSGIFLTVLGFGMGNYKDSMMEKLADHGNGNYAYIDTILEAKKVLGEQLSGTLVTIAKDVKIQVEFNPAEVEGYRLIGYENRMLKAEDFKDDKKDAGEIGAGHTVTALYEIVPRGKKLPAGDVDPLKYQAPAAATEASKSGELLTVKIRYKAPEGDTSQELSFPAKDGGAAYSAATPDFLFAASVAAFGMLLRESPHKGASTIELVQELARPGLADDPTGYRNEYFGLVSKAAGLKRR